MGDKIKIWHILKANNKNLELWENIIFFILPLVIALILVESPFSFILRGVLIDNLIVVMSISIPLSISLLALMYNIGHNIMGRSFASDEMNKIGSVEKVSQSIVFTVIISIIVVIILGIILLVHNLPAHEISMTTVIIFNTVSSLIVFYLLGLIILTTLMILKNTYLLVSSTF